MHTDGSQEKITIQLLTSAATDEVLVDAAKLGDRPAFAELWRRYSNLAFNVGYRITRDRDDAEDVAQDTWMKAYLHLKTFDGRAKFSTWLTRIAINSALMILRKRHRRREIYPAMDEGHIWNRWDVADKTQDVEELFARRETKERLRQAVCRLTPAMRQVVEIHQLGDRSIKEIAELADISVSATKSRLLRARTVLRGLLGGASK
jgi:RNA polymerase sigma-70 factor (ECF subfamily)